MKPNPKDEAKSRRKEIAKTILLTVGMVALVGGVLVFPGIGPMVKWIDDMVAEHKRESRLSFYRMKKRGMLKVESRAGKTRIVLTSKGWRRFRRYQIENLTIKKGQQWDGWWRLAMFDVPEAAKTKRNLIRGKLLQLGFVTVQKSVFIQPYPCDEAIEILRDHYKLAPGQLYVFEARVKEGEARLRSHFKV